MAGGLGKDKKGGGEKAMCGQGLQHLPSFRGLQEKCSAPAEKTHMETLGLDCTQLSWSPKVSSMPHPVKDCSCNGCGSHRRRKTNCIPVLEATEGQSPSPGLGSEQLNQH